jgi:glycosyltransferase involved in cell wall biosynthesis
MIKNNQTFQPNNDHKGREKLRVLFIPLEFPSWNKARSWGYPGNFAIEEGLIANNADCFIIPALYAIPSSSPASWLSRAKDLCKGKRFDQVWIGLVHSPYEESFLDWISTLAPVRVGCLFESLEYHPYEYSQSSVLKTRKEYVTNQMRNLTHVFCSDEGDVDYINTACRVKAIWSPTFVPRRFFSTTYNVPKNNTAVFFGSLYSVERKSWAQRPDLRDLLAFPESPEDSTRCPQMFDALHVKVLTYLQQNLPVNELLLKQYVDSLRTLRQEAFTAWMTGLRDWTAVVNFPSYGKVYTSRVCESMAAGRPAISWDIPHRPRNRALFVENNEILLYDRNDPLGLVEHISHLQRDPDFARFIVKNAQSKVLQYHTAEMRIKQILDWIETGTEPDYGESVLMDTDKSVTERITHIPSTREVKPKDFRVIAIIASHNEGDVIYHVIGDLVKQGIEVYLLDNCSTDNTVQEASKWLGKGLIHIENFPQDSNYPEQSKKEYMWSHILRRKEELAATLDADWFIHFDADEFRESPWPGLSFYEAIYVVDKSGCNAIDFSLLVFHPTDNSFVPGADVREALKYYKINENTTQVKAWKKQDKPVDLVSNGGHDVKLEEKKVYPVKFILRHYPIRSQSHGTKKVFQERKQRFNAQERKFGWHCHYDKMNDENYNFICNASDLKLYDRNEVSLSLLSAPAQAIKQQLLREPAQKRAALKMPTPASHAAEVKTGLADTNNNTALNNLAQLYFDKQDYDQAISKCEAALLKDGKDVDALVLLCNCYLEKNAYDAALIGYQKALELMPKHKDAKKGLALAKQAVKLR